MFRFIGVFLLITAQVFAATGNQVISATSPLVLTNGRMSMPQASGSANGYLSSTDWSRFNSGSGGSGITTLNTLTATTQTFANGSSGLAPAFSSSGSTHTLNLPLAATTSVTAGLLSHSDYLTFSAAAPSANPSFTGSINTPLTASRALVTDSFSDLGVSLTTGTELGFVHGVTSAIQTQLNLLAPLASPTFSGTIGTPLTVSSVVKTDSSGNLTTGTVPLAGDVGGNSSASTISASTVTGKALTGFVSGAGTVSATDSILTAIDKMVANIALPITMSGDVGGTSSASTISASTVTGKALTGFVSGAGSVSATDSILTAVDKIVGNLALKAPLASPTFSGTIGTPLTASSVVQTDVSGNLTTGTVGVSQINATGTPSSSTYLRGDGSWSGVSASTTWGSITGTLSSQTDLNTALGLKAPLASPTFTGTVTTPLGAGIVSSSSGGVLSAVSPVPIANGGTNATSVTTSPTASSFAGWDASKNFSTNAIIPAYQTVASAAGTTTLTVASPQITYVTGATTQTILLPVASTMTSLGQYFLISNRSTGVVTVQSSGGNAVQSMATGTDLLAKVILLSGTTAASWDATYLPNSLANVNQAILFPTTNTYSIGNSSYTANPANVYAYTGVYAGAGLFQLNFSGASGTALSNGTLVYAISSNGSGMIMKQPLGIDTGWPIYAVTDGNAYIGFNTTLGYARPNWIATKLQYDLGGNSSGATLHPAVRFKAPSEVTTTDATLTTYDTYSPASGSAGYYEAVCIAFNSSNSSKFRLNATVTNLTGTVAVAATEMIGTDYNPGAYGGVSWAASGSNILLQITGKASTTISWSCKVVQTANF